MTSIIKPKSVTFNESTTMELNGNQSKSISPTSISSNEEILNAITSSQWVVLSSNKSLEKSQATQFNQIKNYLKHPK